MNQPCSLLVHYMYNYMSSDHVHTDSYSGMQLYVGDQRGLAIITLVVDT